MTRAARGHDVLLHEEVAGTTLVARETRLEVDEAALAVGARPAARDHTVQGHGAAGSPRDVATGIEAAAVGVRGERQVVAGAEIEAPAVAADATAVHRDDTVELEIAVELAELVRVDVARVDRDRAPRAVEVGRGVGAHDHAGAEDLDVARRQHVELAAVAAEGVGRAAAHEERRGVDGEGAAGQRPAEEVLAGVELDETAETAANGAVGVDGAVGERDVVAGGRAELAAVAAAAAAIDRARHRDVGARLEIAGAARAGVLTGERDVAVDRDAADVCDYVELPAVGEAIAGVGERAVTGSVDDRARLDEDVLRRVESDRPRGVAGDVDVAVDVDGARAHERDQAAADDEAVRLHEIAARFQLAGRGEGDVAGVHHLDEAETRHLESALEAERPPAEVELAPAGGHLDRDGDPDQRRGAGAGRAEDVGRIGDRIGTAAPRNGERRRRGSEGRA